MNTPTTKRSTLLPPPLAKLTSSADVIRHERPDSGEAFLHDPTESRPRFHSDEPLAEMLGEDYVRSATSGEETYHDDEDDVRPEELSGSLRAASEDEDLDDDDELETSTLVRGSFVPPHRTAVRPT